MKYLKLFENHLNDYFVIGDIEYKVIFKPFRDGLSLDFAVWDKDSNIFSFDERPKGLDIDKFSNIIKSLLNQKSKPIYIIPNSESKYRLYKILLNRMKFEYSEDMSGKGMKMLILR